LPRNGAGTFGVINPIVVGALRSSSAVNANFTDAGDEITNSLPINGEAGMTGQFRADDGALLTPGISFSADTNTGFRRSATDEMRWVGGGVDRATMDANGKLTLAGALSVAGSLTHSSGRLGPQTMAGTGAARATLRRGENDTTERELVSYQSGNGSGAKGSLREVGGGANDVATMRFYVNDVLAFQWTGSLFTHSVDTLFGASGIRGDTDGFLDFPEIATPSAPASNIARAYARDDAGTTRLYCKDAGGSELAFQPPIDRQVFTASGTWTKPAAGQALALIEAWGGGGGGFTSSSFGSGGGGGSYSRTVIALASISSTVSIIIGSGGTISGSGSNTSFGSYLMAFGGGGGDLTPGGGGGGMSGAGIEATSSVGVDGGAPLGRLGSGIWGDGFDGAAGNANPFGGGGSGDQANAGSALMGGGGGTGGFGVNGIGGASIFGGGGGGGDAGDGGIGVIHGGNGGAGGVAGTEPGGGGGRGAAGARGEVRITCW
jgi:hypothetical protein